MAWEVLVAMEAIVSSEVTAALVVYQDMEVFLV
nr:hypothetical protein CPGR_00747 [Mycolicibacterium malmesburyense]